MAPADLIAHEEVLQDIDRGLLHPIAFERLDAPLRDQIRAGYLVRALAGERGVETAAANIDRHSARRRVAQMAKPP